MTFVRNKTVYIALGVMPNGTKDILGLWIEQTEGAKFWLGRILHLARRRCTGRIARQSALACLQEFLGPSVIHRCGNALAAAQFGYVLLAA